MLNNKPTLNDLLKQLRFNWTRDDSSPTGGFWIAYSKLFYKQHINIFGKSHDRLKAYKFLCQEFKDKIGQKS